MKHPDADQALCDYLRAHWKAKYKNLNRAADFLGYSAQLLSQIQQGVSFPNDKILADAGVKVTRTISWVKI